MNAPSILRGLTLSLALLALPAAAHAADGFARSSGTLRAGAGSDYPAVMRISSGTSLDVIGCTSRYTWCDVAVDGERGWFPGGRIGFLRDGRRVYLSDDTSMLGLTILSFGMADYWGSHYSSRPWYNERRWWRGHGPMPPHLSDRPHIGGPGPIPTPGDHPPRIGGPDREPPQVGTPGPRLEPGGGVKLRDRVDGTPKVRVSHPIAEPIRRAPHGVVRPNPQRALGGAVRRQRPQMQQRQAPQGNGQRLMPPDRTVISPRAARTSERLLSPSALPMRRPPPPRSR